MKVDILGTEYTIVFKDIEKDPSLKDRELLGYIDYTVKEIVIANIEETPYTVKNLECCQRETIRHEIIHAFLKESGLQSESEWAENEEMVDYFAIQFPKILKAFEEAGAIKTGITVKNRGRVPPALVFDEEEEMSVTD